MYVTKARVEGSPLRWTRGIGDRRGRKRAGDVRRRNGRQSGAHDHVDGHVSAWNQRGLKASVPLHYFYHDDPASVDVEAEAKKGYDERRLAAAL